MEVAAGDEDAVATASREGASQPWMPRVLPAFARVTGGMEVIESMAQVPTDPETESPREPLVIRQVQILPVDAAHNPYPTLLSPSTTQPADASEVPPPLDAPPPPMPQQRGTDLPGAGSH